MINFPDFPPLPPYDAGIDPTTSSSWPPRGPDGNYASNTPDDEGYMQVLLKQLSEIDAHPGATGNYLVLAKTLMFLSQLKNPNGSSVLTASDISFLNNTANLTNLLKTGIDAAAQDYFINGSSDGSIKPGTMSALIQFPLQLLQDINNLKSQGVDNIFLDAMQNEITTNFTDAQGNPTQAAQDFLNQHIAGANAGTDVYGNTINAGDIIWTFKETFTQNGQTVTRNVIYDWTAAQAASASGNTSEWVQNTLNKITDTIANTNIAGGPNSDISTLDNALGKMQMMDALYTFEETLKEYADPGLAILAFFFEMEGYKMNQGLSGPADVMDKQQKLSQWSQEIENKLKGLSNGISGADAKTIAGDTISLAQTIQESGQFSGLDNAVSQLKGTLQSTQIAFPPGQTANPPVTRSLWDLFTDSTVKGSDLASALQNALGTGSLPPPSGISPPSSLPNPGTEFLQAITGAFGGIASAVSSNSNQQTTIVQQYQALIQAMDKVMTGVTDKTMGMNVGVIQKIISQSTVS